MKSYLPPLRPLPFIVLALLVLALAACQDAGESATPTPRPATPTTAAVAPTAAPTEAPTAVPTAAPTDVPTAAPTATVESPPTPEPTAAPSPTPAAARIPQDLAMQIVGGFIMAMQNDLDKSAALDYLSLDLRASVTAGRPLAGIAGVLQPFPGFRLQLLSDGGLNGRAKVRAIYDLEEPVYSVYTLMREEGAWRIVNVAQHNLARANDPDTLLVVEDTIVAYYQALAEGNTSVAYDLLSPAFQTQVSEAALAPVADGLRKLSITTMQPIRVRADLVVMYTRLFATLEGEATERWRAGDNARWITVVNTSDGWRIDDITLSPLLSAVTSWRRVIVPEVEMTLDVPASWIRPGVAYAWSPDPLGLPIVGVEWREVAAGWTDEQLLPADRVDLGQTPADLGWATGTQYTYELSGAGDIVLAVETRMVVQSDQRAYAFYARAATEEGLADLRPIFQRMVAAIAITDTTARSYNAIETSISFFSELLRDESGASALPYLADNLRAGAGDRAAILARLGLTSMYRTFNVAWLDTAADGATNVRVTLNGPDGVVTRVLTLAQTPDESWRITAVRFE